MSSSDNADETTPETPAQRRARLLRAAALLGDLEPSASRDETSEGWGERGTPSRDDEFRRDVPPHHGS